MAKKIPGKSIERYVYNKLNKIALRQDGALLALLQWEFTKYDHFGRVIMTGIYATTNSQTTLQTAFDGATQSYETRLATAATSISDVGYSNLSLPIISGIADINTLYYYDNYANIRACLSANSTAIVPSSDIQMASGIAPITYSTTATGVSNAAVTVNTTADLDTYKFAGQLMAVRRRVFTPNGSTLWADMSAQWNNTLYFYDRYGRPTIETNYLPTGGKTVTHRTYTFDGQVDTEITKQQLLSNTATSVNINRVYWVKKVNYYDNDGRLNTYTLQTAFTPAVGDSPTFSAAQQAATYQYNELGQLSQKRLHTVTDGTTYWQNVNYLYNVRGELTAINNVATQCPPATFAPDNSTDNEVQKIANNQQEKEEEQQQEEQEEEEEEVTYNCAQAIDPDSSYNCLINYPFTTDSLLAIAQNLPNYMQYDPAALEPITKRFEGATITTVQVLQLLQGAINQPLTAAWHWRKRDLAYQNGLDTINLSRFKLLYQQLQDAVLTHAAQQCQQTPPPALATYQTPTTNNTQENAKTTQTPQTPQTPEVPQPPMPPMPPMPPPPPTTYTTDANDLFAMGLYYNGYNTANDLGGIANTPAYNGNIAASSWRMGNNTSCQKHVYAYTYDAADRLTNALYAQQVGIGTTTNLNRYDETATYNRNGDILTMVRKGAITGGSFGTSDNLSYTYPTTGILSQLQKIAETGDNTTGFTDQTPSATTDYTYDANGNMLTDQNKKLSFTYYPTLNQPKAISSTAAPNNKIEWVYDATGNKLAKASVVSGTTDKQYYFGSFEYTNQHFRTYYHPEGRIANTTNTPTTATVLRYEYYLRDHLGNPRVLFTDLNVPANGITFNDIIQTNTYYPYGANNTNLSNGTPTIPNDYKYNNKEYIDDLSLNMLDYGARLYDPLTTRWNGVDALAEKYNSTTGYGYVAGNPVSRVDLDGRDWYVKSTGNYLTKGLYQWFEGSNPITGFIHVGKYKVEYDLSTNAVNVYEGANSTFVESISMNTEKDDKGNFVKYNDDRAAKFAMISAESGGYNINDTDIFFDPLIISASIDNRQFLADKGYIRFGASVGQEYKGYQSTKYSSYKDFSIGYKKRHNGSIFAQNLSLTTVYNALDEPIFKLQTHYKMQNANYVLYYSHLGGKAQSAPAYNIAYPKGKSNRFVSVQGDNKYKALLDR